MANNTLSHRILVVDDDKEIVRLVRSYLEQAGYSVLTAHDGNTTLQSIRSNRPDLVVLDLMLPKRDGLEIIRVVRSDETLARIPIIMLTARVEDIDKILGLELGADDYITKPFNPREVVARVRTVLRRSVGENGSSQTRVLQIDQVLMDLGRHEVIVEGKPVELTQTEFKLLQHMMENPGYAFTRAELIQNGLGYEYEGIERTLDSHIKNLRKKSNQMSNSRSIFRRFMASVIDFGSKHMNRLWIRLTLVIAAIVLVSTGTMAITARLLVNQSVR